MFNPDEELEQLTGDLKNLAEQLKESRIYGRLKDNSVPIDHLEEFIEILAAYTNDDEVTQLFKLADKEGNMGGIVAKMREEAIAEEKKKRIEAETLLQDKYEQLQDEYGQLQVKYGQLQDEYGQLQDKIIQTMVEFVKNKDFKGLETFVQKLD